MENTDKKRQQTLDEIREQAEKTFDKLSPAEKVLLAGHNLSIIEQIKSFADSAGISREVLLFIYAGLIFNAVIPESKSEAPKPITAYKPFKSGYIQ